MMANGDERPSFQQTRAAHHPLLPREPVVADPEFSQLKYFLQSDNPHVKSQRVMMEQPVLPKLKHRKTILDRFRRGATTGPKSRRKRGTSHLQNDQNSPNVARPSDDFSSRFFVQKSSLNGSRYYSIVTDEPQAEKFRADTRSQDSKTYSGLEIEESKEGDNYEDIPTQITKLRAKILQDQQLPRSSSVYSRHSFSEEDVSELQVLSGEKLVQEPFNEPRDPSIEGSDSQTLNAEEKSITKDSHLTIEGILTRIKDHETTGHRLSRRLEGVHSVVEPGGMGPLSSHPTLIGPAPDRPLPELPQEAECQRRRQTQNEIAGLHVARALECLEGVASAPRPPSWASMEALSIEDAESRGVKEDIPETFPNVFCLPTPDRKLDIKHGNNRRKSGTQFMKFHHPHIETPPKRLPRAPPPSPISPRGNNSSRKASVESRRARTRARKLRDLPPKKGSSDTIKIDLNDGMDPSFNKQHDSMIDFPANTIKEDVQSTFLGNHELSFRIATLERENRLLQAALQAVLKTNGKVNGCPFVNSVDMTSTSSISETLDQVRRFLIPLDTSMLEIGAKSHTNRHSRRSSRSYASSRRSPSALDMYLATRKGSSTMKAEQDRMRVSQLEEIQVKIPERKGDDDEPFDSSS